MRPASVIFLVIGLLLVIVGSVICGRAERLASDDGFSLLEKEEDAEGNTIKTYEITKASEDDPEVNKILVRIEGVDVEIRGGEERSFVEIYNKNGVFNCYISNKVMKISNQLKLAEIVESNGSNFEFNGLRRYMDFDIFRTKEKKVVIHLCETDPLKQIELQVTGCNVTMTGVQEDIDLIVKATAATVDLQDIRTASIISVTGKDCSFNCSDLLFSEMNVKGENCKLSLNERGYGSLYTFGYTVTADGTEMIVNGAPVGGGSYSYGYKDEHSFTADLVGGTLDLQY